MLGFYSASILNHTEQVHMPSNYMLMNMCREFHCGGKNVFKGCNSPHWEGDLRLNRSRMTSIQH